MRAIEGKNERHETFKADLERLAESRVLDCFGNDRETNIEFLFNLWLDTGWALFDVDGSGLEEIQRIDDADIFESDDEALEHVKVRASEGSKKHLDALEVHRRHELALIAMRRKP